MFPVPQNNVTLPIAVDTLADLSLLSLVSGFGWGDTESPPTAGEGIQVWVHETTSFWIARPDLTGVSTPSQIPMLGGGLWIESEGIETGGLFWVRNFGAIGDGVTNDSAAISNAIAAVQANGGGTLIFDAGNRYLCSMPAGVPAGASGVFATMTVNGIALVSTGRSTIVDNTVYADTSSSVFVRFIGCKGIRLLGIDFESQDIIGVDAPNTTGLYCYEFRQGCEGILADIRTTGCLVALHPIKEALDPIGFRSSGLDGTITSTRTYYPLLTERSGDNSKFAINATLCGRSVFLIGCHSIQAAVVQKNAVRTNEIAAYGGDGCSDITLSVYDRDSDNNNLDSRVSLQWSDTVAATLQNIHIALDVFANALSPFAQSVTLFKVANAAVGGHKLINFELTGISNQTGGHAHLATIGVPWVSPDVIQDIDVHNFVGTGATSDIDVDFANALVGTSFFRGVSCERNLMAVNSTGRFEFQGCIAGGSMSRVNDTSPQSYFDSFITAGTQQSWVNKTVREVDFKGFKTNGDWRFSLNDNIKKSLANRSALFFILRDGGRAGLFALRGANNTTELLASTAAGFSPTLNNAGTTNVAYDPIAASYVVQNSSGDGLVNYTAWDLTHFQNLSPS